MARSAIVKGLDRRFWRTCLPRTRSYKGWSAEVQLLSRNSARMFKLARHQVLISYSGQNPSEALNIHQGKIRDGASECRSLHSRHLEAKRMAAAAGVHHFAKTAPISQDQSAVGERGCGLRIRFTNHVGLKPPLVGVSVRVIGSADEEIQRQNPALEIPPEDGIPA